MDQADKDGRTPLFTAAHTGHLAMAKLLLSGKAGPLLEFPRLLFCGEQEGRGLLNFRRGSTGNFDLG